MQSADAICIANDSPPYTFKHFIPQSSTMRRKSLPSLSLVSNQQLSSALSKRSSFDPALRSHHSLLWPLLSWMAQGKAAAPSKHAN